MLIIDISIWKVCAHKISFILQENKLIIETNEELNAQLLANSLQEGRSLVNQGTEVSLADEFETLTKDEVSCGLKKNK